MDNYKPNSNKYKKELTDGKTEEKKVTKVVKGKVKSKKKNEVQKLADVFISEDVANVKSYILMDVLIPAVKKAVSDIVTNGIDMILYGGTGKSSNGSKYTYRNYNSFSSGSNHVNRTRAVGAGYNFDNVILETRSEAESVLMGMDELIETYGVVSVGDLYDLVGISGTYTDNKYGWTDIHNASVVRVRDGYMIKLPRALPIE